VGHACHPSSGRPAQRKSSGEAILVNKLGSDSVCLWSHMHRSEDPRQKIQVRGPKWQRPQCLCPGFSAARLVLHTAGVAHVEGHPQRGRLSWHTGGPHLLHRVARGGSVHAECFPEAEPSSSSTPISASGPSPFPREMVTILYSMNCHVNLLPTGYEDD
jgi:hypothetical protein